MVYAVGLPPSSSYKFKHALIRDAAYEALLKTRRRELHTRIARIIEERFSEQGTLRPEILAYHCTEAGLILQAVRYWREAGENASKRSANVEAISHLRRALELIKGLPEGSERLMEEVKLQTVLTTPLIATTGYTAPEVEAAGNRALDLYQQLGDSAESFSVLRILHTIYFNRGELEITLQLVRQLLYRANISRDPPLLLWAHYALGFTLAARGNLKAARDHLERSIAFYEPHRAGAYGYVQDPGPTAMALFVFVARVEL